MFKNFFKKEDKLIDCNNELEKNESVNDVTASSDSLNVSNSHDKTLSFARVLASKSLNENVSSILEKDTNLNRIILESCKFYVKEY